MVFRVGSTLAFALVATAFAAAPVTAEHADYLCVAEDPDGQPVCVLQCLDFDDGMSYCATHNEPGNICVAYVYHRYVEDYWSCGLVVNRNEVCLGRGGNDPGLCLVP